MATDDTIYMCGKAANDGCKLARKSSSPYLSIVYVEHPDAAAAPPFDAVVRQRPANSSNRKAAGRRCQRLSDAQPTLHLLERHSLGFNHHGSDPDQLQHH